jgi:hypothetical protein
MKCDICGRQPVTAIASATQTPHATALAAERSRTTLYLEGMESRFICAHGAEETSTRPPSRPVRVRWHSAA